MHRKLFFQRYRSFFALLLLSLSYFYLVPAFAVSFPNRPADNTFYVDEANIISPATAEEINRISTSLLREKGIPLLVVTIPSLQAQGAQDTSIEGYTRALFDFWGVGSQDRNYGMIFLIAKNDRKARIELGASYGQDYNQSSNQIMNTIVIPQFRQGDYSAGILAGVKGLDNMARGIAIKSGAASSAKSFVPSNNNSSTFNPATGEQQSNGSKLLTILIGVVMVILAISLFRSGRSGWGWAVLAALAGFIAYNFWNRNDRNGGGGDSGGFGGGSFGGGSSGGGGSTGSW